MIKQISTTTKLDRFLQRVRDRDAPSAALRALIKFGEESEKSAQAFRYRIADCGDLAERLVRLLKTPSLFPTSVIGKIEEAFENVEMSTLHRLSVGVELLREMPGRLDSASQQTVLRAALIRAVTAAEFEPVAKCDALAVALLPANGALLLARELGPVYLSFLQQTIVEHGAWCELEQQVLEFDHRSATWQLLPYWGVPAAMLGPWEKTKDFDADRSQPIVEDADSQSLAKAIYLADLLSEALIFERIDQFAFFLTAWQKHGGTTLEHLEQTISDLSGKVIALAEALQIPFDARPALHDVYIRLKEQAGEQNSATSCDVEQLLMETRSLTAIARAPQRTVPGRSLLMAAMPEPIQAPIYAPSDIVKRLDFAITDCRQSRSALSLILLEAHGDFEHASEQLANTPNSFVGRLNSALRDLAGNQNKILALAARRWAIPLRGLDKQAAVDAAKRLLSDLHAWSRNIDEDDRPAYNISIGIASLTLPPKNFPPQELYDAAQRCLNAARSAGTNAVKSIDL